MAGSAIKQARLLAWCAGSGAHCLLTPGDYNAHYRKARCRWTREPGVAECTFKVDVPGQSPVADRQLIRRDRSSWVAFWRD